MKRIPAQRMIAASIVLSLSALAAAAGDTPRRSTYVVRDGKVISTSDHNSLPQNFRAGDLLSGGYIGVELTQMTPELRSYFGVSKEEGVLVSRVSEDSPADKAGLRAGDVITSIDGKSIKSAMDVSRAVREKKEGDQVSISFNRKGASQQAFASVKEREKQLFDITKFGEGAGVRVFVNEDGGPEAAGRLREMLSSPEWKARMDSLGDCSKVQTRLQDLEKKLQDLEKRLQQK